VRYQQQYNTPTNNTIITYPQEKGLVFASLRHWEETKEDHAAVVAVAVAVVRVVFAYSQRDRHRVGCGWEVETY